MPISTLRASSEPRQWPPQPLWHGSRACSLLSSVPPLPFACDASPRILLTPSPPHPLTTSPPHHLTTSPPHHLTPPPTVAQDLDDALCLTFLFASLASSKFVPAARIQNCKRLHREFQSYIVRTRSLRKTFISIKGIYYQAEVQGSTLTWVEPHSFAQQPTMAVDYRVMLSFLELYESVLTFVLFKLYHDLGLSYPPEIDPSLDGSGAYLSAMLLKEKEADAVAPVAPGFMKPLHQNPGEVALKAIAPKLSKAQTKSLQQKIASIGDMEGEEADGEAAVEEAKEAAEAEAKEAAEQDAMMMQARMMPDTAREHPPKYSILIPTVPMPDRYPPPTPPKPTPYPYRRRCHPTSRPSIRSSPIASSFAVARLQSLRSSCWCSPRPAASGGRATRHRLRRMMRASHTR